VVSRGIAEVVKSKMSSTYRWK